jgi:hypothetical protein
MKKLEDETQAGVLFAKGSKNGETSVTFNNV